jgi:hypothetical protein
MLAHWEKCAPARRHFLKPGRSRVDRNDADDSKGFRKVGSLIPKSVRAVDSERSGSETSSDGSGSIIGRGVAGSPTSGRPGSSGSIAPVLTLAEALATRDSDKVDRALLCSLPSSVTAALREHLAEGSWTGPYGFDPVTESFELERPVEAADLMQAIALVGQALQPAPGEVISNELVRLRVLTASRGHDLALERAMFNVYLEELGEYPADVVVDACRAWGRREKFWPSGAELRAECDRRVLRRKRLRDALKAAAA